MQILLNLWNRNFFDSLERKDAQALWVLGAIVRSAGRGKHPAGRRVGMGTHDGATQLARGIDAASHRKMARTRNGSASSIIFVKGSENPEYRIAVDIRIATDAPIDLALAFFSSLLTAIAFFSVLWTIGGSIDIVIFGRTVTIPGYLVIGVIIYSGAMSASHGFFRPSPDQRD